MCAVARSDVTNGSRRTLVCASECTIEKKSHLKLYCIHSCGHIGTAGEADVERVRHLVVMKVCILLSSSALTVSGTSAAEPKSDRVASVCCEWNGCGGRSATRGEIQQWGWRR